MNIADLRISRLIFEIRYDDAFEVWDRAGEIHRALVKLWPNTRLAETKPNQQVLRGDQVQLQTGIRTSHVALFDVNSITKHADQIADTYRVWADVLSFKELKRVGTRVIYRKRYASDSEAGAAFLSLGFIRTVDMPSFGHSGPPSGGEVRLTWKDEAAATTLTVKNEEQTLEIEAVPDFAEGGKKLVRNDFVVDIDRATSKPIELSQFRVQDWLQGVQRIVSRALPQMLRDHEAW